MTSSACGSCGAPTGDGAYLDAGCTRDLAGQLLLAASIASDLDDAVARLIKRGSGGKASGHEVPLPINLYAATAKSNLRQRLAYWVIAVVDARPDTVRSWPSGTIDGKARWLTDHLGQLRQLEDAAKMLAEMRTAVGDALVVIDRIPERAPAGTCEACGQPLLAELGADEVRCGCGSLTVALLAKRRERAAAADVLGTPAAVSAALDRIGVSVPRGTITSWVSRGRIALRPGGVVAMSEVLAMKAQSTARVRG